MPKANPRVYLDIAIGTRTGGRIIVELFTDSTPRTAENFRGLCTGEYGKGRTTKKDLTYEGCSFFRAVKGNYVQSGDFQFNNGDGGESIYGGKFNDEDFSRRHTQAGVLSMANSGRNSNGSQFFITLKRSTQLDGKHVVFGQVVDGMDVVRAISQIPVDKDERPRVAVHIVGCGETDRQVKKQDTPTLQLAQQIAELTDEIAPPKANNATKGKAILAGKEGGAPVPDSTKESSSSSRRGSGAGDDEEEGAAMAPPRNDRERRLMEMRLRMNQCRAANSKEVVEEQKRHADPEYSKRQAEQRHKRTLEKQEEAGGEKALDAARRGSLPEGKEHLGETMEHCEQREAKKKKGNPDAFGWDVFNQDSLYRAHEKRLRHIQFDEESYQKQKQQEESGDTSLFGGFGFKPSEDQKDRLGEAMDKIIAKKQEFSRRRDHIADEDVDYVDQRNRHFNKKVERFYGEYTHETRQNLERGTAL